MSIPEHLAPLLGPEITQRNHRFVVDSPSAYACIACTLHRSKVASRKGCTAQRLILCIQVHLLKAALLKASSFTYTCIANRLHRSKPHPLHTLAARLRQGGSLFRSLQPAARVAALISRRSAGAERVGTGVPRCFNKVWACLMNKQGRGSEVPAKVVARCPAVHLQSGVSRAPEASWFSPSNGNPFEGTARLALPLLGMDMLMQCYAEPVRGTITCGAACCTCCDNHALSIKARQQPHLALHFQASCALPLLRGLQQLLGRLRHVDATRNTYSQESQPEMSGTPPSCSNFQQRFLSCLRHVDATRRACSQGLRPEVCQASLHAKHQAANQVLPYPSRGNLAPTHCQPPKVAKAALGMRVRARQPGALIIIMMIVILILITNDKLPVLWVKQQQHGG
eukprot:683350-Pelagomonas_calceolata.AAC.4